MFKALVILLVVFLVLFLVPPSVSYVSARDQADYVTILCAATAASASSSSVCNVSFDLNSTARPWYIGYCTSWWGATLRSGKDTSSYPAVLVTITVNGKEYVTESFAFTYGTIWNHGFHIYGDPGDTIMVELQIQPAASKVLTGYVATSYTIAGGG